MDNSNFRLTSQTSDTNRQNDYTANSSLIEICQKFGEAVCNSGLITDIRFSPNADEPYPTRFYVEGDKRRTKNGWYRLAIGSNNAFGIFGTWKNPYEWNKWSFKSETEMTPEEIKLFHKESKFLEQTFEKDKEELYKAAAQKAQLILGKSKPATDDYEYLSKKNVKAYSIFIEALTDDVKKDLGKEERLIVPMQDINGSICNIQYISKTGKKWFLTGARKTGCFCIIGDPNSHIIRIAEGYSTGASIFESVGNCVIVAIDCGNLLPVARLIRQRYSHAHIQICGDNDFLRKDGNIGLIKAREAAEAIGCSWIVPNFDEIDPDIVKNEMLSDWNDLAAWSGIDNVKLQLERNIEIQRKPMLLQRALSSPQPFPVQALGEILEPLVCKIADVVQAPFGICGQSVLAAVALAVQGYADIIIDGRIIPLSEFFLTIGASGERKSAIDSIVLHAHRAHQDNLRQKYEVDYLHWLALNEAYESAKKETLKKASTYEQKQRAMETLGFPPIRPLDPLILIEEPTYEGLIKLLITGQPSIGLFSDEGGRFIGGHGMNSDNLLKTAAGLSGLWDGKQVSRVRAGDSVALLSGRRVSFHLMVQPNVAQLMLSNPLLIEQGLISRCLITWPTSTAGSRFYKEINLNNTTEFKNYISRINEIFKTPLATVEKKENELLPRKISLTAEAKALFIKFHDTVEKSVGDNQQLSQIRGFANKAPEHALRLAGIIALFKNINCEKIDTESMCSGIELATYYLNEALRLHDSSTLDPDLVLADKLLNWLHSHKKTDFPLGEIYQLGPSSIRNAKTARKLMLILVDHGWAIPLKEGLIDNGAHRKEAWRIVS